MALWIASAANPPTESVSASPGLSAAASGVRGRDPWVFRCIFEDRTQMVIAAPAEDLWVAFNPRTCAIHKVWRGDMLFRGKVWDFSQDNCAPGPQADVLLSAPATVLTLPDAAEPGPAWTIDKMHFEPGHGWKLDAPDSSLVSPLFDLTGWSNVFIAIDETSRTAPFQFEFSGDGGKTWDLQTFRSATHGASPTDWQWNFKAVNTDPAPNRFRVSLPSPAPDKALRNLRLFGDRVAWQARTDDKPIAASLTWRGYTLSKSESGRETLTLRYDIVLPTGAAIRVDQAIDASATQDGTVTVDEQFDVARLPDRTVLTLELPRSTAGSEPARAISGVAALESDDHRWLLTYYRPGATSLTTTIVPRSEDPR